MRAMRPASGRRRRRALRVVAAPDLAATNAVVRGIEWQLTIGPDEAGAYEVGLHAAKLLHLHFPAFYQEHAAALSITPGLLLGCCVAFWHLVEERGISIRWPGDYTGAIERGATTLESLTMFDDVSVEFLSEMGYSLWTPRPKYFGLGVQSVLEECSHIPNILTVTLWHLFQHTPLSIGMPLSFEALSKEYDEDLIVRIFRIKPLPKQVALNTMLNLLDIPEAADVGGDGGVAMLVEYAFGKTNNGLANWTDYEVEAITNGEEDEQWDWTAMDELARLSAEAQLLEACYEAWSLRITRDPEREIVKLAGALHKAARQAEREITEVGTPLITLLGDNPAEARRYIEMVNAL